MHRRQYLAALGTATAGGLAGCSALFETQSRTPPVLSERPDAVYVPTHVEGMGMVGRAQSGRYRLALTYSFPHRFWLVNGVRTNRVEIASDDSAHLMVSVWDGETGTVIPSSNARIAVSQGGESVVEKSMWPMLSQNMGFHYGDNVALGGDGTYEVRVDFGPVGQRKTGGFVDAFGEQASHTFTFEFSPSRMEENISFRRLEGRAGERDAVAPMRMEMLPTPQLPAPADLPGTVLGEGSTGDGRFVLTRLASTPAGVEASGQYLAVSPRTPYNRYPLPFMALDATVQRGGETVHEAQLTPTLDPDLKYHYGTTLDAVEPGDTVEVSVVTPPQVARHEGYETAFVDMQSVSVTVE